MEHPGVSKLVGVRFGRNGDNGDSDSVSVEITGSEDELPESIKERLSSEVTIAPDDASPSS
jgi:hypothetical protein